MTELSAFNVDSVAYYGEMDDKSRNENYHKWKDGEVNVIVATIVPLAWALTSLI